VEASDEPPVPRTPASPAIDGLLRKLSVDGDVRLRHGDPAGALGSYMLAAYLGNREAGRHLEKMDEAAPVPVVLDKTVNEPVDSCEIKVVSIAPFASTSSTLAMGLRLAPKDGKSRARIEHVGADSGNAQLIVSRAPEKGSPVLLALIGIPRTASRIDMIAVCGGHASSIKLPLARVLANINLANQTGDRR
jgi:hypothetical protein